VPHRNKREVTGPATCEFRAFQRQDRADCLALFDGNCPEFFAPNERDDYERFLDGTVAGYYVCLSGGQIIAAFGVSTGIPTRCRLSWILVAQEWQRRGVGKTIMTEVIRVAAARTRVRSQRSAPYFAKCGAEEVGRLQDGWGPGMHRVDMELCLASATTGVCR
jgi:GNAT superfamily N-acetyltransferase